VRWLVAHGARVDAIDTQGITPLMLAATAERAGALELLLQSKAHVAAVDALGNSALFYAARRGRIAQAERLVAAGLDPNLRNAGGWSAVDYSVQSKQDTVTGYLVQHGAQPARRHKTGTASGSRPSGPFLRSSANDAYAGWPDVALAASRSDPVMLKSVLARGGDPEATTLTGQPALPGRRVIARYRRGPARCWSLTDAPGSRGPHAARSGRQSGPQGNRPGVARARSQPERAWCQR
jgi:ankyrin repeat protein